MVAKKLRLVSSSPDASDRIAKGQFEIKSLFGRRGLRGNPMVDASSLVKHEFSEALFIRDAGLNMRLFGEAAGDLTKAIGDHHEFRGTEWRAIGP